MKIVTMHTTRTNKSKRQEILPWRVNQIRTKVHWVLTSAGLQDRRASWSMVSLWPRGKRILAEEPGFKEEEAWEPRMDQKCLSSREGQSPSITAGEQHMACFTEYHVGGTWLHSSGIHVSQWETRFSCSQEEHRVPSLFPRGPKMNSSLSIHTTPRPLERGLWGLQGSECQLQVAPVTAAALRRLP